ncbi:MAG: phosphatidate cytidylyltransferase [Evtepia sp.]
MRSRILVGLVGAPVLLLILFVLPTWFLPVAIAFLSGIAAEEMSGALKLRDIRIRILTILLTIAVPFWVYFGELPHYALCGMLLYVVILFAIALPSHYEIKIEQIGVSFFFAILVPYFLSSVIRIGAIGQCYILIPVMIPFVSDIFAMLSGMCFGKHKLAPELSPKKTVEGSIGGVVGAVVILLLYGFLTTFYYAFPVNYLYLLCYGIVGSLISQLGDLSFSYVKRQTGIKDYGSFFKAHGGVLDRFDSVIFCAPFVELIIRFLPAFMQK